MRLLQISALVAAVALSPNCAVAQQLKLFCTNENGYPGPILELNFDTRTLTVADKFERDFVVDSSNRFVTYFEYYGIGGSVNILDLSTGKRRATSLMQYEGQIMEAPVVDMVCTKGLLD